MLCDNAQLHDVMHNLLTSSLLPHELLEAGWGPSDATFATTTAQVNVTVHLCCVVSCQVLLPHITCYCWSDVNRHVYVCGAAGVVCTSACACCA